MLEADINSQETYSLQEAISFIGEAAPDAAEVSDSSYISSDDSFAIRWNGNNRVEVFYHLAKHGWIVTSSDRNCIWFEQLE